MEQDYLETFRQSKHEVILPMRWTAQNMLAAP